MSNKEQQINIRPRRILNILLVITASLAVFNVIGQYLRFKRFAIDPTAEFFLDLFINQFSMNNEANIPTYYSSLLLLTASVLLLFISVWKYQHKDRLRFHWALLAVVLLIFSIDEFTSIHEQFIRLFKDFPDFNGLFYFKWVIPGIIFVGVLALVYLPFFFHLESKTKVLFLVSVVTYFMGALGMEIVGGRYANYNTMKSFQFSLITTVEETLEIAGVSLLIYTLLKYLENLLSGIVLKIGSADHLKGMQE
ncbi:MAG: hypothetical protein JXA13_17170 [Anaerolineales bacterium]|nr:hypothetical protein [Anaerolineales bacterium]